ncbi:MAG: LL-diaminopimelate aminotransferase [Planctomycetota bacterium]|nr:MAG: LL-diaminopimelate aminotransferase [Planctomycetota bacterium]
MQIRVARRLQELGGYAFAEVDRAVEQLRAQGIEPIDLGVGDPSDPTPEPIRRACQQAVERHAASGYPSYAGSPAFRAAVAEWTRRRFGIELDPQTEITSSLGSKEAIFHVAEALVEPGEIVLCPSPGYPPYARGARFAEAQPWFYPLRPENGFLPELEAIPPEVAARARLLWINYPNSPTGRVASLAELERIAAWARARGIVLCSDEPYSEIYFTEEPPPSALQCGKEGVLVFQSLSKRSHMTGYRVGWVAGDARLVAALRRLKTNIDSGTPWFIQDAAIAALGDEEHVARARASYRARRDALLEGLAAAGLEPCPPEGTFYVWQRLPAGLSSVEFARRLLAPQIAVVCTPGAWLGEPLADGTHPGEGYVRFALVAPLERIQEAARRLAALRLR